MEPTAQCLDRIREQLGSRTRKRTRPQFALRLVFVGLAFVVGMATVKAYELARSAGWLGPKKPVTEPSRSQNPSRLKGRSKAALATSPAATAENPGAPPEGVTLPEPTPAVGLPTVLPKAAPDSGAVASTSPRQRTTVATKLALLAPEREDKPPVAPALEPVAPTVPSTSTAPKAAAAPATFDEVSTLDHALVLLRRERNAPAALPAIDAYLARYPHGVLNSEARLARIDALLMLRRSAEALAALDPLPLDSGRRLAELQVIRGELRAGSNCAAAEADFGAALAHSPDAGLLERILYGRGYCRVQRGDLLGAKSDLSRYVERFPNGLHAQWARNWLEKNSKASASGG